MMTIAISGRIPSHVTKRDLERALRLTCTAARKQPTGFVSLGFISDAAMKTLNRKWRGKNCTTDVLSFAPADVMDVRGVPKNWGDILISPTYVKASAAEQGVAYREELLRVTSHGMLHLFGYDHATKAEEKRMFAMQERVVRAVA